MRVLLMSPVAGRDTAGGDVSYTEALVARPPEGVTYTTYDVALAEGTLVERGRRPRHGRPSGTDAAILAARIVETGLRRSGLLFREPYHYLTPQPGAFDLVHAHVFTVRLVDSDVPLVTSSGFPLSVLYEDRFHWSHRRVVAASVADRGLSRSTGTELPWRPPRRAARTMVPSRHYRDTLVAAGGDPGRVAVRALGIDGDPASPRAGPPTTVGFIGMMFEEKGGDVALAAFADFRAEHPGARLVVVGCDPPSRDVGLPDGSVVWTGRVSRQRLLDELFPEIDVLLLPTRCDSGVPYVLVEALQRGIPVVASTYPWLDERLAGPGALRVPADPPSVVGALRQLFDPDTYAEASRAAIELWRTRYSMEVLAEQIGATYREALAANW